MVKFPDRQKHEFKATKGLARRYSWLVLSAESAIKVQQELLARIPDTVADADADIMHVLLNTVTAMLKTPSDVSIKFIKDLLIASNTQIEYENNMIDCVDLGFFTGNLPELYEVVFWILKSNFEDVFTMARAAI